MKKFEPSRHFVSKVMQKVRAHEEMKPESSPAPLFAAAGIIRPALSIGGALLGIVNLLRILFSVFSPAHCL